MLVGPDVVEGAIVDKVGTTDGKLVIGIADGVLVETNEGGDVGFKEGLLE